MGAIIKTLLLVALFILSACSAQYVATQENPAAGFPFRHSDFDYKVAWKTTEANNAVVIDGILKNVRYPYIESLDITVFLLGSDGKIRTRASTIPTPQRSQTGEVIPFSVELRNATLNQGDVFKFVIHYLADLGGPESGIDWHSTFAVDAMTGAVLHRDSLKPEEW
ncbi:MAG: hypothetical protein P4L44_11040 [Oryzomonas sp.]|uniref:hypothetical protein n=1 Tax=Oryzomonas sp. TaxID=2855186 RepID=UPI00284FA0D5|nr:hypothetical protein [Oryzomonas sp.]MDR3580487.1 hypothetical protein [Oryzomonas sp.]